MPVGWTRINTPEELRELLDDTDAFGAKAEELVERSGAVMNHILWEKSGRVAHIVTGVPARDAEAVFARLDENIGPTERLYNGEEIRRLRDWGIE